MANSSYLNKIVERRLEGGARVTDESQYQFKRIFPTEPFAQRRRAADVPSSRIRVQVIILNDPASPKVRRMWFRTSRAVRTGRSAA
jgi:hypothetical protein